MKLVKLLDAGLAVVDGEDHFFYSQFNKIDNIRYVVVAYEDEEPSGCGAIKEFEADTVEIKRMFVNPECRRKGIAMAILSELEKWARELSFTRCILETGKGSRMQSGFIKKQDIYRLQTMDNMQEWETVYASKRT